MQRATSVSAEMNERYAIFSINSRSAFLTVV
jgi:hypothetical protein